MDLGYADAMPVSVFTTQPAPLAASFVRLISRVHFSDPMNRHVKHDLRQLVTYLLFDMSYEGDYMEFGEEIQEDIDREINCALESFRKWEGWRDDEIWIADALEAIIQGQGDYDHLPGMPFKDVR